MNTSRNIASTLGVAFTLAVLAASVAVAAPPPLTSHDSGVWQQHKYSFAFMGFTSTYSCDGLADQLKRLLIASGARPDVKSQPGACASGFGRPDKFARAELTFYTLAPQGDAAGDGAASEAAASNDETDATPAASDKSSTSTAAGDHADAQSTGKPVAAIWRPVALAARSPRELRTGDCELVEQFRRQVLPMFTTRNVEDHTTCIPHQNSGSVINLKFESLSAVPPKHVKAH